MLRKSQFVGRTQEKSPPYSYTGADPGILKGGGGGGGGGVQRNFLQKGGGGVSGIFFKRGEGVQPLTCVNLYQIRRRTPHPPSPVSAPATEGTEMRRYTKKNSQLGELA